MGYRHADQPTRGRRERLRAYRSYFPPTRRLLPREPTDLPARSASGSVLLPAPGMAVIVQAHYLTIDRD
jgi:hypothetical protein